MKRLFLAWTTATMWAALPGVGLASSGELSQAPQLQALVMSALQEFGVPGVAIGVWTPGGSWTMTAGLADVASGRPVRRPDHFGIRSVTKSFTVTLMLQCVASSHGAISLDDPIGKYLPNIPNGQTITLRELANMTSGLYNYTRSPAFGEALQADPTRSWTTDGLLALAFDDPSHSPIDFQPGTQYEYSNTNTLVLGKLVEVLTGQPFAEVLAERILLPLELGSTSFVTGTKLPRPAVNGYQGTNDDGVPDNVVISSSGLGFAGAIASTLDDLADWGAALAEGSLLPSSLQQQRFVARSTAGDPGSPVYDAYGLGMGEVAGWWGHTGEGAGFEAAVFHRIDRDETFAVLLNASNTRDVPVKIFCRVLQVLNESPSAGSGSVCAAPAE